MIVCLFFKKKVLKIEEYCSTSNRYWLPWSYNDELLTTVCYKCEGTLFSQGNMI